MEPRILYTFQVIQKLISIFKLTGAKGQIRLAGETLLEKMNHTNLTFKVLKEISLLNLNLHIVDMCIIANYVKKEQYQWV